MSEHSEEELLGCTLIFPLVLLMQLSLFILINQKVWNVKQIPGMVRLIDHCPFPSLLLKYNETHALAAAPPVPASPTQALIPVDAVLTSPSRFCSEPVTAERGAVKQNV